MSQENVEATTHLWDAFLSGDMTAVLTFIDGDVEVHDMPELPGATVYRGHDGFLEQIARLREVFAEMNFRVLEHIDCGDSVVTVSAVSGRAVGSGISGGVAYAATSTWRDGKIVSIRNFRSKEAALEAAGLSE